ncbi:MAG: response regulator, partial [Saprospiraceae bacterium]|nr:response regulator [Saprospiraceae bacterium]
MILIIDDDIAVQTSLSLLLQQNGFQTATASGRAESLIFLRKQKPQLILLDLNFSVNTTGEEGLSLLAEIKDIDASIPVILITGWATIDLAVKGMQAGARDFISKPWDNAHLLQSIQTIFDLEHLSTDSLTRKKLDQDYQLDYLIGQAPEFLRILEHLMRIAPTNASVLILGESGTGKELIAEAIHQNSKR